MFSTILSNIKELETNGLVISGHVVKATGFFFFFCIAGDNLGSHNIGFTENFSASTYFCRYCLVTRSELPDVQKGVPPQTVQNYSEALEELQNGALTESRGLEFDSVFMSLSYFHVCEEHKISKMFARLLQSYLNTSSFFAHILQVKESTPFNAELYSDAVHSAIEGSLPGECNLLYTEIQ